jgi:hypothetical protein
MAKRHTFKLRNILETVAFEGYAAEPKEFFLLAYGDGQKRFTSAVRDYIKEIWEDLRDDISESLNWDLSETSLTFSETPKGRILITRDDLSWE